MTSNTNLAALVANTTAEREPFVLEILRRNCDAVAPELERAYLDPIMMMVTACAIPVLSMIAEHAVSLIIDQVPKLLGATFSAIVTAARSAMRKFTTATGTADQSDGHDSSLNAHKRNSVVAPAKPPTWGDGCEVIARICFCVSVLPTGTKVCD